MDTTDLCSRSSCDVPDVLRYELLQEMAASLGNAGRRVQNTLDALAGSPSDAADRESLLDEAAGALWCYIVQREACGLRDSETVMDSLGVPAAVRNRLGYRPSTPSISR